MFDIFGIYIIVSLPAQVDDLSGREHGQDFDKAEREYFKPQVIG